MIIVFTGPTLPPFEAQRELDALLLPPAAEGDVYRATLREPRAIGIIDGYFEVRPSVWHKEILYALSRGIRVFGSASMGALRAAELEAFGMEGVGAVFEALRDGLLEDDDEVAVIHGPPELGYPPLSEAMVNIRRTLSDARASGVIMGRTCEVLEHAAKSLFYRDRNYAKVLALGRQAGLPSRELRRLSDWLPTGRVDQKRLDALRMLRRMREWLATESSPFVARFHFENTTHWQRARQSSQAD